MKTKIQEHLNKSINAKKAILKAGVDEIAEAGLKLISVIKNGGKILVCGNGGSAADAQHFTAELVGRFKLERKAYPAIAFTTNTSILTAIGNDYGYDEIFLRQLQALAQPKDLLFGITTSGKSANVIKAFEYAKKNNIFTISLTGSPGMPLAGFADIALVVPFHETAIIQEAHICVIHILCMLLDEYGQMS